MPEILSTDSARDKGQPQIPDSKKEAEKLPLFFIVYRENDLFKEYVPLVVASLKELGYKINYQIFPAGTSEEEMKSWYFVHEKELQLCNVLADNTTQASSEYKMHNGALGGLDDFMNDAVERVVMGEESSLEELRSESHKDPLKKQEYLSALGEMYRRILAAIPEAKRQKMKIVILKGLLDDFPPLIAHEPFCPAREDQKSIEKETSAFAEEMKKWFEQAGISNVSIFSTGAEIPTRTIADLCNGRAQIIFDRHTFIDDPEVMLTEKGTEMMEEFWGDNVRYSSLIKETSALQTPVETFYYDVSRKVGLTVAPEKLEQAIKEKITSVLNKE